MNKPCSALAIIALLLLLGVKPLPASLTLPVSTDKHAQLADAVFAGNVLSNSSFRPPGETAIYTRTIVQVTEVFKGKVPPLVQLVHPGGFLDGRGEVDDLSPTFREGERRLLFVHRGKDGALTTVFGEASALRLSSPAKALARSPNAGSSAAPGDAVAAALRTQTAVGGLAGADVTDQQVSANAVAPSGGRQTMTRLDAVSTATNLFVGADGLSARWLGPDRAEPIPYLVDADYLPAGITLAQAMSALNAALAAWTNVSSVRFAFAGYQSFGTASANITSADGFLRIQLHDFYQFIGNAGEVLGRGGNRWALSTVPPGWTLGGNVAGNDFHKAVSGWVVLQHTSSFFQNQANMAEVLCHEIGHALSLNHSSDNPNEPNPLLNQAIMYQTAHGDGRGAAINSVDANILKQVHPQLNTPPYCYDRYMDAITTPSPRAGMNIIRFTGYDLQSTNLTLATTNTSNSGTFSVSGNVISYDANAFYNSPRIDPGSGSYYAVLYARFSDGLNASPYAMVRVISHNPDNYYEDIPDAWRLQYFGSANPNTGVNHHANQDSDGDGLTNLQEYRLGLDPTDRNSTFRSSVNSSGILQWPAKAYELYQVYGSTDLVHWTRAFNPAIPKTSTASLVVTNAQPARQFYRVLKVP